MLLGCALNHGFRRSARLLSLSADEKGDALTEAQLALSVAAVPVGQQPCSLQPKAAEVKQAGTKRKDYIRIRGM